jgi:Methylmalonyl-CoA mutase
LLLKRFCSSYSDWEIQLRKALKGAEWRTLVRQTEDGLSYPLLAHRVPQQRLMSSSGRPASDRPWMGADGPWMGENGPRMGENGPRSSFTTPSINDPLHSRFERSINERSGMGTKDPDEVQTGDTTVRGWTFGARIDHPTLDGVKRQLDEALDLKPDYLHVVLSGEPQAHGFGVSPEGLNFLESFCEERPITLFKDTISSDLLDGRNLHNQGASAVQELGACLSKLIALARAAHHAGTPFDAGALRVVLAVDERFVEGIAKLRAWRALVQRVLSVLGREGIVGDHILPPRLLVETSARSLMARDPWTNILRATYASIGAILGGCDALTVLPYTLKHGLADGEARRLSLTLPLILREEGLLSGAGDPLTGAGSIEALTGSMAEAAWTYMQKLEAVGGLLSEEGAALLSADMAQMSAQRDAMITSGARPIIGTTVHLFDEPEIFVEGL